MLIDLEVFEKVSRPWFAITWKPEIDDYEGEDWHFCAKAEKAGFGIYIDHQLSSQIGHWGDMKYDLNLIVREGEHEDIAKVFEARPGRNGDIVNPALNDIVLKGS